MNFLLDTNVLSELRKKDCRTSVRNFVDSLEQTSLFISVISIGEIAFGVERLPPGRRKNEFRYFIDTQIPDWFEDRIIPLDCKIMRAWGRLCAEDDAGGRRRTLPTFDSLIAASALVHGLAILTRNVKDFAGLEGLFLVDPWEEEPPLDL